VAAAVAAETARHAQRRSQTVSLQGACSPLHGAAAGRWALTQLLSVCGREQHGTDSSVRINDVFFAGHAFCLSALTLCQCVLFERGTQRVHEHTRLAFAIMLPLTVTYAAAAWLFPADISVISCAPPASGAACAHPWSSTHACSGLRRLRPPLQLCPLLEPPLDPPVENPPGDVTLKVATAQPGALARRFLYYLSMIKIAVTLAKYVPQVLLNRERRSTSGFSIAQVPRVAGAADSVVCEQLQH
jgi:hypothetical protein